MSANIAVLSTGGTIASTGGTSGAAPSKTGEDLIDSVPEIQEHATVDVEQVCQRPSFNMDIDSIERIRRGAREAIEEGVNAVVVTHGTDTMEESAYYLDLVLEADTPVIFTGAQRRPDEVSADGPANILTAVRAGSDERITDAGGVYIAFDEKLHAARDVTKHHTKDLNTFKSLDKGPVAVFDRDDVRIYREPGSYSKTIDAPAPTGNVRQVKSGVGVDETMIENCLSENVDGLVVEGTGLGNTTASLGNAVSSAVSRGVPVVVTSRCPAGPTAAVYGSDGGGQTLVSEGAIHGDDLPAHKARVKLLLALEADEGAAALDSYFHAY